MHLGRIFIFSDVEQGLMSFFLVDHVYDLCYNNQTLPQCVKTAINNPEQVVVAVFWL